jgi:hypothetical protein
VFAGYAVLIEMNVGRQGSSDDLFGLLQVVGLAEVAAIDDYEGGRGGDNAVL